MSVSKKLWPIPKESRWKYSWLLCFFVLLPFVSFQSTLDPELQPRIFLISLLCFFFYLFQIWAEIKINYPTKRILFISSLIIGVTGLSIVNSINTGEALSELLRIFMVYSVLFISILVFSNQKQNPVSRFEELERAVRKDLEDLMKSLNQQQIQQLETIKEKELKELSSELGSAFGWKKPILK